MRILIVFVIISFIGVLSYYLRTPFLFPSIGPTLIAFVHNPKKSQNHPLSIILGHAFAASVAIAMLFLFGLYGLPSTLQAGFTPLRIAAVSLSMGITGVFEEGTPFFHPPAGATTLVISLGLMQNASQLAGIAGGVLLVAVAATLYGRFARLHPQVSTLKVQSATGGEASIERDAGLT